MAKKVDFTLSGCSSEESERVVNAVNALLTRPIAFQPIFAEICEDLNAGLMLSQLWYWKDNKSAVQRGGWFYKTRSEWKEETFLSRFQQEQARKLLKKRKFIVESFHGSPPKLYFKVSFGHVIDAIIARLEQSQQARN